MMKYILLVEIGTEELPSKILRKFGESFARNIELRCKMLNNIIFEKVIWFASSRRLAVKVINIVFSSYKNDFCNKYSLYKDSNITLLLSDIIHHALIKLPVSMLMRWREGNVRFVRPVRTVTVLLNDEIVACNFFGIFSNRMIRGHQFMGDKEIILDHAKNYEEILFKKGYVVVDYEQRKDIIRSGIENVSKKIGGKVDYSENLLEEVTALSEWPIVLFGAFDKNFLHIPKEILLYIMKCQKKYFPLYNLKGELLPYFIFVIDIITENNKQIITFHEKVLHLSFSDAEFFLNCDKKYLLEEYLSRLRTVLFHKELGSLYDKSMRIKILSTWVASEIGVSVYQAERAAVLSKCDLLSNMVFEFPFSQGIIGMYYALRDGELKEVALAQKEQYQPRFSSDSLPSGSISCVISIVDKIDTISGMFVIGEYPKGSRDPMGLRRAAIGVLRIIVEKRLSINLWRLVECSLDLYENFLTDDLIGKIIDFMYKRLCILYERKGYKIDVIRGTLSGTLSNLWDFDRRISAVSSFCLLEESRLLFLMYKRIFNILEGVSGLCKYEVNNALLFQEEEVYLSKKVLVVHQELQLMYERGNYYDALMLLMSLYVPLDNFFKSVIVMVEDKYLRINRLVLLNKVYGLLLKIINTPNHIFHMAYHIK